MKGIQSYAPTTAAYLAHNPHAKPLRARPVEELVCGLAHAFAEEPQDANEVEVQGSKIQHILEEYASSHDDWKMYQHWCDVKYSRNLIARTDKFELIAICWKEGQVSPIHNHEGQRCWMGVLSGKLSETYFRFKDTKSTRGSGALEQTEVNFIEQGEVGYITADIALHVIRPEGGDAVSLHLYSYPIPECNIYCPATGTVTRRKAGYFTEFKPTAPYQAQ